MLFRSIYSANGTITANATVVAVGNRIGDNWTVEAEGSETWTAQTAATTVWTNVSTVSETWTATTATVTTWTNISSGTEQWQ